MTTRVDRASEIVLNSKRYNIEGVISSSLIEAQPERQTVHLDDWRGGLGVEIIDEELAPNRYFWSTANTLFKGHLILPRLAVTTGTAPALDPSVMAALAGTVYARWSTVVHSYNNGSDTWGAAVHTGLNSVVGDFINITIDQTTYLVIADGTDYHYSSDGSSWSTSTRDVNYLTYFDDQMWGITLQGQLWSSYTMGTETHKACLAVEGVTNGELVTDLFTAPGNDGETGIFVATNRGLWHYDLDNDRFVGISSLSVPAGLTNGTGTTFWRNSIFFPAGSEIYAYTPGQTPTLDEIGPGNDSHGLPSDQKGRIIQLLPTHNELLALVDTTALSSNTAASFSVLAYNIRHQSWRCLYEHGTANVTPTAMFADNSYGIYRLYIAYGTSGDIDYINLPYEVTNDLSTTDATYASSAEHITSWVTVEDDRTAAAIRVFLHTKGLSANETVKLDYEIDFAGSWTNLGTETAAGVKQYDFPNSSTPTGSDFTHIRFRVTLASTATNTNTPDMLSLDLEFRTKKKPRWAHGVTLDMRDTSPDGRSPREQFADVRTVVENTTMVEMTFRDGDSSYVYYVDVAGAQGTEETASDFRAQMQLVLIES